MRLAERNARTVGRRPGLEEIDARIVDVARLVKFPEQLNHPDRSLARPEAKLDDLPGLQATNLTVDETIGGGLGKMQKIEQTKTTRTSHSGIPAG